jgi:hypothetical protein
VNSASDTIQSVFLFVNSDSDSTNRSHQATSLLQALREYLSRQRYCLSEVESTKQGNASFGVTLQKCDISVLLGVGSRPLGEITIITDTLQPSGLSPQVGSEWSMLCQDIEDFLLQELRVSSLRRLTRNQAEFLWRSRQRSGLKGRSTA